MEDVTHQAMMEQLYAILNHIGWNFFPKNWKVSGMGIFLYASAVHISFGCFLLVSFETQTIIEIMDTIATAGVALQVVMKYLCLLVWRQTWVLMFKEVAATRSTQLVTPKFRKILENWSRRELTFVRCMIFSYFLAVFLLCLEPLFDRDPFKWPVAFKWPNTNHPLLVAFLYAFDCLLAFEGILLAIGTETLFVILVGHLVSQLEIAIQMLDTLDADLLATHVDKWAVRRRLANEQLIDLHRFMADFKKFFKLMSIGMKPILLCQFAGAMIMLCMTLLIAMDSIMNGKLLYLNAAIIQSFIYCYGGELVVSTNDRLIEKVYRIRWYNLDVAGQRSLRLLLFAVQDTPWVSAIFFPLTRQTFVQILKTSYSYCVVMQKMDD